MKLPINEEEDSIEVDCIEQPQSGPYLITNIKILMYKVIITFNYKCNDAFKSLLAEMVKITDIGEGDYRTYYKRIDRHVDIINHVANIFHHRPQEQHISVFYRPSENDSFTYFGRGIDGEVSKYRVTGSHTTYLGSQWFKDGIANSYNVITMNV